MEGMTMARKLKISISLDAARCSTPSTGGRRRKRRRAARSWSNGCEAASRQAELQRLEEETAAYYDALTPARKGRRRGVGGVRVAIGPKAHDRRAADHRRAAPFAAEMTCRRRGHLYWAEMDKRRPVLVVISTDARNERANDVIVIPCSTAMREAPTHVRRGARRRGNPARIPCSSASRSRR